jgi:hypothetical protein
VRDGSFFSVDVQQYSVYTRRVLGEFQLSIPVRMGDVLLPREIRKLAPLRYVAGCSDRRPLASSVCALLGADCQQDPWPRRRSEQCQAVIGRSDASANKTRTGREMRDGKVCEVVYDCFGDFEGFVLATCCGRHSFRSREPGIEVLARRASIERSTVAVYHECGASHHICRLVLSCHGGGAQRAVSRRAVERIEQFGR